MHPLLASAHVAPPPTTAAPPQPASCGSPASASASASAAEADAARPARTIVVGSARMDRVARPGTLCWYCAHPSTNAPMLPMPLAYDPKTDVFRVTGSFCGFSCMKSYNFDRGDYLKHVNAINISLFAKRCTGKIQRIHLAPPRQALRAFGGSMSIEEFRGDTRSWSILPPKMVTADVVIQEQRACGRKPAKAQNLAASVDFKDVLVKNETLKLRRPKPMQTTRNALDRTMGINQLLMSV
jgi:hypothetical protein